MLLGKTCVFDGHSHFAFKLGVLGRCVIGVWRQDTGRKRGFLSLFVGYAERVDHLLINTGVKPGEGNGVFSH